MVEARVRLTRTTRQDFKIQLDEFVRLLTIGNNHKIHSEPEKSNMSESELVRIVIDTLRAQIPVSREESMRWVEDDASMMADAV